MDPNVKLIPGQREPDSCHSRMIRNQQYLYPKFPPTVVVKLLQYSGSRVELKDGFSSIAWLQNVHNMAYIAPQTCENTKLT